MSTAAKVVSTLIIALVIVVVAFGYSYSKKARMMLSDTLSEKLKVPVQIEDVSFTLRNITIKNLKIDNLPNSNLPTAFSAKRILIKAPLWNYLKGNVVIDEIIVESIYIGLEFDDINSEKGNWTRLIENFYTQMDNANQTQSDRSVEIKKISLYNIQAQVVYKTKPKTIHNFPVVKHEEFTDIKSQGGVPIDQITNSVLGKMLMSLFVRENLKNMYKQFLNPKNVIKNALTPFKMLIP